MSKLFGTLFGKKATAVPTSQQTQSSMQGIGAMPNYAQSSFQDLVQRAGGISGQTAPFAPVPFVPRQLKAMEYLGRDPTQQTFDLDRRGSDAFTQSLGYLGDASGNIARGTNPITGQEIQTGINQFMNPYTDQVVNTTLADIMRQGQGLGSDISAQASNAGAYGGTRQALAESELARNLLGESGRAAGGLRSQGFEFSAGNALQNLMNERNRFLTGAGLNIDQSGQAIGAGNAMMGAYGNLADVQRQQALDKLGIGNMVQQQQQQQQQIPLAQTSYLQSILQGLPTAQTQMGQNTGSTLRENPGILSQIGKAGKTIGGALSGFMT